MLIGGLVVALIGFRAAGNAANGVGVAVVLFVTSSVDPANLNPSLSDLSCPICPGSR